MKNNTRGIKTTKAISVFLLIALLAAVFTSCEFFGGGSGSGQAQRVDYVSELTLDMSSDSLKQVATVKAYIDGDTTHFYVPKSVSSSGVLKARYIAINTPESTGRIEEYGKKASNFTKEKLKNAESIILESDNDKWNADSTGDRYLVWVWYRNSATEEYRNLNIEILQEGLAIGSNSGQNRYGDTALDALNQAKNLKYNVFSGEKDPDFYYGEAVSVTLAELRTNIQNYDGVKVAFDATVARCYNDGVYVEAYDEETGTHNGIYIYYGQDLAQLGSKGLGIISTIGNYVKVVGKVSYYETGNSYQVTDLKLKAREPDNPDNIKLISSGNEVPYTEIDADLFTSKVSRVAIVDEEEVLKEFDYAELLLATSVSMKGLVVDSIYTTTNEESSDKGAMTLTCKVGDKTVVVRTAVLKDADGNIITEEYFDGKTMDVQGIVDCFDGTYQIKVFRLDDITIK